jgi:hypothetical protein
VRNLDSPAAVSSKKALDIATVSGRNGKEVLKWSKSEDLPMPDNRRDFTLPGFSVGFKKGKYTK